MNRFLILIKSSNHTFFLIQDLRSKPLFAEVPVPTAPYLFTVSLTESEIGLTQQASVRRGPRASAPYLFTASVCSPRFRRPISQQASVRRTSLLGLTQQASVRRGPRASAPSHFTVSLTESEIGLTQQASVRQGPRASVPYLFTVSLTESEASAFLPNRVCVSPIEDRDLRTPAAACVW